MPESPDFDKLATVIAACTQIDIDDTHPRSRSIVVRGIAEQLRLVWNARGAADLDLRTAVETVVNRFTADEAQGYQSRDRQYAIEVLGRALKGIS